MNKGRFKDKNKPNKGYKSNAPEGPIRVRTPREGEVIGVLVQRYGAARMLVRCTDGKERNCRIPGALRRKLWVREGNIILVKPWELDDEKGDIIFQYNPTAVQWLRKKGFLDNLNEEL